MVDYLNAPHLYNWGGRLASLNVLIATNAEQLVDST